MYVIAPEKMFISKDKTTFLIIRSISLTVIDVKHPPKYDIKWMAYNFKADARLSGTTDLEGLVKRLQDMEATQEWIG